jgi:hypothetical protein
MKALKICGGVALVLWMLWASLELIQTRAIALEACGLAATHGEGADGGIHLPVVCPNLDYNEVMQEKSK